MKTTIELNCWHKTDDLNKTLVIKSDSTDESRIILEFGDEKVTVDKGPLIKAIRRCTYP